jgi:hypothetical protein
MGGQNGRQIEERQKHQEAKERQEESSITSSRNGWQILVFCDTAGLLTKTFSF